MNRRDFTRLGAAGVWTWPALRAWAGNLDYPWNLGIITDQVDLDLNRVLSSFYTKYHLRWTEIRYLKLDGAKSYVYADATQTQLKQVKRRLDDAGVKLSVLDTAVYKITLPGSIPVGETRSYSWMAKRLGDENARRAVGRANGTNMICIIIPCHRVIRADGTLCGYGGGLWRKKWLLDHEQRCVHR